MSSQLRHRLQPSMMKVSNGFTDSLDPIYAGHEQEYTISRPEASSAAPIAA